MTWIYDNGTISKGFTPEYQSDATVYFEGSEFAQLPKDGVPTGIKGYVVDWANLDSSTQSAIGSQLLMFAAKAKAWLPQ